MRPTSAEFNDRLDYDPSSGVLRWRATGKRAGTQPTKTRLYRRIGFNGGEYLEHVVIFVMVTGQWPTLQIDHRDRDKTNNRWSNLREVTHGENQQNNDGYANNTSGYTGVSWSKRNKRWSAVVRRDKKDHWLGYHRTAEQAHQAVCKFKEVKHG